MCGIVGTWGRASTQDALTSSITALRDELVHRGPDSAGVWIDASAGLALGHRRLAIVDLSEAGHQPMVSATGRHVVTFNGEIFNHDEMRREIEAEGTRFRGTSDTEVLLAYIERFGVQATARRANGQFAWGVWDRETRTLSLVRDRLGIKPLYFGRLGSDLVFASELRCFRVHPACTRQLDLDAVHSLMRYGCISGRNSIFKGVEKLAPGTIAVFTDPTSAPSRTTFWSPTLAYERGLAVPFRDSPEAAVDALEEQLERSTALRRIADVPLGAFLSGGVDSSTVVAIMQRQATTPVNTYSIGFADQAYDEASHARAVAQHLGTDHTEVIMRPEHAVELLPRLATLTDEPFADMSLLPTFLVSQLARTQVTVSLSGDGGDELFGGYNRHIWGPRLWRAMRRLPFGVRQGAARTLHRLPPTTYDRMYARLAGRLPQSMRVRLAGRKIHKIASLLDSQSQGDLYDRLRNQWVGAPPIQGPWGSALAGETPDGMGFAERMMLLDLQTYLPDDILTKVDRASMAVSLEARVPLLDHNVVEFAWSLPLSMKIRDGVTKWPLRQLLYRHVPRALVERPKMGFTLPMDAWLRTELRDWAEDLLTPEALSASEVFEVDAVRSAWASHLRGQQDAASALWPALMLQAWLRG